MENTSLLLSVSTFFIIMCFYFSVAAVLAARKTNKDLIKRTERWNKKIINSSNPVKKRKGAFDFLGLSGSAAESDISMYSDTPLFYQRAGIYNGQTIRFYEVFRIIFLLLPIVIIASSRFVAGRPFTSPILLIILVSAAIGYYLPVLWLKVVARGRKKELNRTFPDAMDLLMVCVEAGLGIDSAISRVSQELYVSSPELAKELKILSLELKTGRSRNSCLKSLAQRADLPDVNNLVSLLIQADKYGTGVASALRIHAEEMRQKRYGRLEELAAKLPIKLTLPLILFIFPAFFVVIMGPAAIQVLRIIIQR